MNNTQTNSVGTLRVGTFVFSPENSAVLAATIMGSPQFNGGTTKAHQVQDILTHYFRRVYVRDTEGLYVYTIIPKPAYPNVQTIVITETINKPPMPAAGTGLVLSGQVHESGVGNVLSPLSAAAVFTPGGAAPAKATMAAQAPVAVAPAKKAAIPQVITKTTEVPNSEVFAPGVVVEFVRGKGTRSEAKTNGMIMSVNDKEIRIGYLKGGYMEYLTIPVADLKSDKFSVKKLLTATV